MQKFNKKHFIYYPLSGRLQAVSPFVFSKIDGKVILFHHQTVVVRVSYPMNYLSVNRKTTKQVSAILQDHFQTEGCYADLKMFISGLSTVMSFISKMAEIKGVFTRKINRQLFMRVASIVARFMHIASQEVFDFVSAISLIGDCVAIKMDFDTEVLEDLALNSFLKFLPSSLKGVVLALLVIKKREGAYLTTVLQTIGDVFTHVLAFLKSLDLPSCISDVIVKLQTMVCLASSHSIVSRCSELVETYKKKPNVLADSIFVRQVIDHHDLMEVGNGKVAAAAAVDLARSNASIKARLDAFQRLYTIVLQLENATRVEPCCFIFDGPPGTLKSVTLGKLLSVLGKSVYVHHVKTATDGKDFYDTYANQDILYMDDVGQQGKSQWRNLINWVSCIPLPLDCAEASLKNTKLLTSSIIMLTTNQFMDLHGFTAQDGVSDVKALFRRAFVFDWNSVRNVDGALEGSMSIKRYNLKLGVWEFLPSHQIPSVFVINKNEDDLLSWMSSWILSLESWKRNCCQSNHLDEVRISKIRNSTRIVNYEPEVDFICGSSSELEDSAGETAEDPFVNAFKSHLNLDEHDNLIYNIHEFPGDEFVSTMFDQVDLINFPGESGAQFVNARHFQWTIKDHIVAVRDWLWQFIKVSIQSIIDIVYTVFTDVAYIPLIITFLMLSIVSWITIKVCTFETQSDQSLLSDWNQVRELVSKTSSQVTALERSNSFEVSIDSKCKMCCLAFDKYIIIPAHAVNRTKRMCKISMKRSYNNQVVLDSVDCVVVFRNELSDIVVLKLPTSHPLTFRDVKFETAVSDFLVTPVGSIEMAKILAAGNFGDIPYSSKGDIVYSNVIGSNKLVYSTHFKGLCGSFVSNREGLIGGMHVAGSNRDALGVALMWSQGVVNTLNALVRSHSPIILKEEGIATSSGAEVDAVGRVFVPNKTNFVKSPLYGVYPVNRTPANLNKFGKNTVNIVFTKSLGVTVDPPVEELEFAREIINDLLPEFSDITMEQCVAGYDNVSGLNKKSSNGFLCLPRKEDYIDFENKCFKPSFLGELDTIESQILEDQVDWQKFAWFETLKDEIRNDEKDGVPRSFRVSTIHQQVLTKLCCADLVSKVMHKRANNQIAIGCNPIDYWPLMMQQLKGKNIFAGDIAKWDGAMLPSVQRLVNEVIVSKYKGTRPLVLKFLLDNLVNSLVIVKDKTYVMTHSMPSGSFLTAFYNSVVNRAYTAMWYKRHTPVACVSRFILEVDDFVYGDDKVVAIVKSRPDLNAKSMQQFFQSINMDFTDANKGEITEEYQNLDQVTFLKRSFEYHNELAQIVCPLSLRTLFNTISWRDSTKMIEEVMDGKIDSVYRELYLHADRDELMREFRNAVECIYGSRKWLTNNQIKNLYENNKETYLIKNFCTQLEY